MKQITEGRVLAERYEICSMLGQGGMGRVYRGYDRRLGKEWAIKVLRYEEGAEKEREEDFSRECSTLKRLNRPFFPRIVDVFREDGRVYLVMDLIEGENLRTLLQREGALSCKEAVRYALALADALSVLHKMQPPVLYLDLKPANVMITREGGVCLVDFGSALEKESPVHGGMRVAGTPGYAAPELSGMSGNFRKKKGKYEGKDVGADVRSDIYSLGMTLYAMLTGQEPDRPPYVRHPVRCLNSAIPRRMEKIVERCVAWRKEDRFGSMEEVSMALKAAEEWNGRHSLQDIAEKAITCLLLGLAALCLSGTAQAGWIDGITGQGLKDVTAGLLLIAAGLLWENLVVERRRRRRKYYRLERSLLLTEKKEGLRDGILCLILFAFLMGGAAGRRTGDAAFERVGQVWAAETKEAALREPSGALVEPLAVLLRDSRLRKLLVRDGCVYSTDREVYIEIPADIFNEGEVMEVSLTARSRLTGDERGYFFLLCRKAQTR